MSEGGDAKKRNSADCVSTTHLLSLNYEEELLDELKGDAADNRQGGRTLTSKAV